jgi:hypothetical protein
MPIELTADEAFDRYKVHLDANALIQGAWHRGGDNGQDGRDLACGLGALDPKINGPRDCPASVMPRWLAQMVPWFFDNQPLDDAKAWGLRFYAELKRLKGVVPFSVIHDWQANFVGPMAIEAAEKRGADPTVHKALAEMQWKALTGEKFTADEWRPILKGAFYDIYLWRYRANAYANAYADVYANANANALAYADVYANANANALAEAEAEADAYAYRARIKMLADGMVECLARVEAP